MCLQPPYNYPLLTRKDPPNTLENSLENALETPWKLALKLLLTYTLLRSNIPYCS